MTTSYDLSELQALLHTLPARLRLVADYVSREDALEREAAAELLDECATRLPAISEFSDSWSYGPAPCFLPDIPEGWAFSAAMTITGPSHG